MGDETLEGEARAPVRIESAAVGSIRRSAAEGEIEAAAIEREARRRESR